MRISFFRAQRGRFISYGASRFPGPSTAQELRDARGSASRESHL